MGDALEFDELQAYFGEDYVVTDKIRVHSPTLGDVIKYGERRYYSLLYLLTAIPSDMKSYLFDAGIDYEEISDFDLFCSLTRGLPPERTSIFLDGVDFSHMELCQFENGERALADPETGTVIDKFVYLKIVTFLRKIHGLKPKVEHAANKTTKRILIELDRQKHKKKSKEEYTSQLKPLISAMMRYPGFKYKSAELRECSLYEFMDTVRGAHIYVRSTALLKGMYSGMIDTSKINKKQFDWARDSNE